MKNNGWIIYRKADAIQNSSYIDWFIEEAKRQGMSLKLIYREALIIGNMEGKRTVRYQKEPIQLPDFAVIRTIDYVLSLHMEAVGVQVFNSSTVAAICNNKALTHHYLQDLGIPMADTIYLERESIPEKAPFPFPFVLKEASGRGGKQVFLIQNDSDWSSRKSALHSKHVLVQTCDVDLGKDVRVFVVGKTIIGSVLRENDDDFRANYKLGGTARRYELNQDEITMIHRIIDQFDFDMVGIDFLLDTSGKLVLNEIEDVVGSRTLSAVSDINILNIYCRHIKQKLST